MRYFWKLASLVFFWLTFKLLNCNMCFVSQWFSIVWSLKKRDNFSLQRAKFWKIHLEIFKYTWNRKEQWISFCLSLSFIIYQGFSPFALCFPLLKYLKTNVIHCVVSLLHIYKYLFLKSIDHNLTIVIITPW